VFAVIVGLVSALNYFYGLFTKAHEAKSKSEDFKETVEKHTEEIQELNDKIDKLVDISNQLIEINKIQTRHYIVETCTWAIEQKEIEQYQLQSLEDMYEMYTQILHGNSYATTMMNKVRTLPIKNTID
jgi:uncharacterized protein YjgD (DUF1641 family)